jgi:WD40 repeat protein
MSDVFISYSRRDKVFTQKLYEALKAVNREVWADWDSIPAASDWDAEIKQGIQETNSVLFVLSPEWIKSNECRKEMIHAVSMGKRLFPILYLPVDPNDVPPELAKINWVYMRDTDDFNKAFQTLCSAMDTDLDWIKTHTRIQVRALEWEKKNRSASFALRGEDLTEGEQFIAGAANKSPVPTSLQSEYILASRKDATRRQRQTLVGITVALVVSIILGVVAAIQWRKADQQLKIARAGDLAAQTELVINRNFRNAILLGIESFLKFDTPRSRGILLDVTTANPQWLNFLTRHTNAVISVTFSPDGTLLASSSFDNTVILWDVATGKELAQFQGDKDDKDGIVAAVAFSLDSKNLSTVNVDGTIILWDIASRQQIRIDKSVPVHNLPKFSPDGRLLATENEDNTIRFWDVVSHKPIPIAPIQGTYPFAFSPDGKTFAVSNDKNITVWDISMILDADAANHQLVGQPFAEASGSIFSIAFSPDGKKLAAGSCKKFGTDDFNPNSHCVENEIIVWNTITRQPIGQPLIEQTFNPDGWGVIAFSPDGNTLASSTCTKRKDVYDINKNNCIESEISYWDLTTYHRISPPSGHTDEIYSLAFSPNGKILASGSADKSVVLWNTGSTNAISETLRGNSDSVGNSNLGIYDIAFDPAGKTLAAGGKADITLWDVTTHQSSHLDGISPMALSPDGKTIASMICKSYDPSTNCLQSEIGLWNVTTHQLLSFKSPLENDAPETVIRLKFSPDGKTLVLGTLSGSILLWDVSKHELSATLHHTNRLFALAFSPDGKILASGGTDGKIILWNTATNQEIDTLDGHVNVVESIAFSPQGKILASGNGDGSIILWDVSSHQSIGQFLGHTNGVYSVAFGPDENTFASGGCSKIDANQCIEGEVFLWDVPTRQSIGQPLRGNTNMVTSVALSPDGKLLASVSADGSVILWDIDPQSWLKKSCQRVGRNLTREEWNKYFPTEDYRQTCKQLPPEPEETPTQIAAP